LNLTDRNELYSIESVCLISWIIIEVLECDGCLWAVGFVRII